MYILRSQKNPKKLIQIGATPVRIGRGSENSLVIREKSVSRMHATIQLESGVPVLIDLNSTRGTYINGKPVRRQRLNPGDVITFGTVRWELEEHAASRETPDSQGLVLASVNNPRQQFPLTRGQVRIGRSAKNQLRIPDKSISREHALIQYENGEFVLADKNSSSGTFVNHKRIRKAILKPGDVIAFGEDQWRVITTEGSQPISAQEQSVRQASIGQFYIGGYSLSPDPVYGGALQSADPGMAPRPEDRRPPIYVRPCNFGAIVDRKSEVQAASASGPNLPLQLFGPHGVGKSTLLCYLAHHPFATTFPDGVIHLLARGRRVIDILQNIHDSFYEQPAGFIATESEIRTRLRSKTALILLDDVEMGPEDISELLDAAPKCTFVLASTQRCLPKGGRILEMKEFKNEDALALFEKVLGRGLNTGELPLVKTICSALGNSPVRIIQAASYVRRVGQSLGGLSSVLNVATPVNGLNSLIIQSLSEVERFVVAILAALGGGSIHNRHMLSLVGSKGTKQVLEGLMGRGLVRESDNRYSLAGSFADYLQEEWDLSDWANRILEHFSSWVERHQDNPEYVLFELEAILSILTWAVRAGRWQGVLRLSRGVEGLLMAGKQWGAWETVLQSGLQAAQVLGDQAAEAWALHQLGTRALCLGDSVTAQSSLGKALEIRQSIGDRIGAELTRQNQNLLSAAIPAPAKPAPAQPPAQPPSSFFLRPWFLVGGAVTVIVTAALIIGNWPTPAPAVIRDTDTPRAEITLTPTPRPISTTRTPSRTPTVIISPTRTRTFTPTNTKTITPTATRTFTPTVTDTELSPPDFGSPQLSTNRLYYGDSSCGTNNVTIRVQAYHPAGIRTVVFFHRLTSLAEGNPKSGWSEGLSMNSVGGGTYSLTVSGDTLIGGSNFGTAEVTYQFVIEPQSGEFARSTFYSGLFLSSCYISPPPITDTPTTPSPIGSISGGAWYDSNSNGIRDSGESGNSGITVTLGSGACDSSGLDSTVTTSSGGFSFNNLSPGTYCVTVDTPYCESQPPTTQMTVVLGWGEDKSISWFGYRSIIC